MSAESVRIDPKKHRGLGRGLSALFDDEEPQQTMQQNVAAAEAPSVGPRLTLPVSKLAPGKFQPRTRFEDDAIRELAESISVHGILQPLLVRPLANDRYEIIAGERRWRAAQKAQLHEVPVIIKEMEDRQALEIALIENLQREDLNPVEEARAFQRLMEDFGHSSEKLSAALGKSRSHIANTIRLLKLPTLVLDMMVDGRLSAGHARALINAADPERLARDVVANGLSVRQTERLVNQVHPEHRKPRGTKAATPTKAKSVDTLALEREVSTALGMKVTLDLKTASEGQLSIHFASLDQLDDVLHRLSHSPGRSGR